MATRRRQRWLDDEDGALLEKMVLTTPDEVEEYLASLGIEVFERLDRWGTLDLRLRVFRAIAGSMRDPGAYTGSIQSGRRWTMFWEPLPLDDLPAASEESLRALFAERDRALALFEPSGCPGYLLRPGVVSEESLGDVDVYLLPEEPAEGWMAPCTHEHFGPYILPAERPERHAPFSPGRASLAGGPSTRSLARRPSPACPLKSDFENRARSIDAAIDGERHVDQTRHVVLYMRPSAGARPNGRAADRGRSAEAWN